LAAQSLRAADEPVVMGMNPRYEQLVAKLLSRWQARGVSPRFFEVGYGSGVFLHRIQQQGYEVAGIEVSAAMREHACRLFGPGHEKDLLLGDVLGWELAPDQPPYHVAYWNDVFEHIPPDEIGDYLDKIHDLLIPGGALVTITPNWHTRPNDVTVAMYPPRTEAAGLHLKEYSLREVTRLLRKRGFSRVATPLFFTHNRAFICRGGLAWLKCLLEPTLEWLPFRLAQILCRGFCLSCTLAAKT
jgi:SAM-dependent methyltransferase